MKLKALQEKFQINISQLSEAEYKNEFERLAIDLSWKSSQIEGNTKELSIEWNVRKRRIGISGTNYRPLDNEFQLSEAFKSACQVINAKENVFEKALLALVLISYIQPFMDGNKRTARIVANAVLMSKNHCPLSFRTVDSIDYKKAMLLFYEQNNISSFKEIFLQQFEFSVNTYF